MKTTFKRLLIVLLLLIGFQTIAQSNIRFIIDTNESLTELQTREINPLKFHLIEIPEMNDSCYLIYTDRETTDLILAELNNYEIVGSWNDKGGFFDDYIDAPDKPDKKPKKDKDKFNKSKYKSKLKKILVYEDENDTEGTLVEAPETTLIVNILGLPRIKIDEDEN